jgi:hypothetical protein
MVSDSEFRVHRGTPDVDPQGNLGFKICQKILLNRRNLYTLALCTHAPGILFLTQNPFRTLFIGGNLCLPQLCYGILD